MNRKRNSQKVIAALLAVIVFFVMSYFMVYESKHVIHECTGEDCPICQELNLANIITKQITSAAGIAAVCFLLTVFIKKMGTVVSGSISERNLIIDKVRIDD